MPRLILPYSSRDLGRKFTAMVSAIEQQEQIPLWIRIALRAKRVHIIGVLKSGSTYKLTFNGVTLEIACTHSRK